MKHIAIAAAITFTLIGCDNTPDVSSVVTSTVTCTEINASLLACNNGETYINANDVPQGVAPSDSGAPQTYCYLPSMGAIDKPCSSDEQCGAFPNECGVYYCDVICKVTYAPTGAPCGDGGTCGEIGSCCGALPL